MTTFSPAKAGWISVLFIFFGLNTQAQLNAEFTALPTSGCSPLVVRFTDQSTGNPTQWRWDLGNGTISFLQNPSVTYFTPGQYNIKLIIQKPGEIDSIIKIQYISIFAQPLTAFMATPATGCFPLPVQFTDQTTTTNSTITNWQWDFGDGTFGNIQNPMHTYTASGNYNVSLVVTNSNGCTKSLTKTNYIQIANGARANFSNNTSNSCTPPVNINFLNLSTGTGVLSYQWNFGDGNTSTQTNPSHNYINPGSYTVRLIVTNTTGCKDTMVRANAVTIGSVLSAFTSPDTTCVGRPTNFINNSTPPPASAFWTFGDGSNSNLINPVKIYSTPGNYQVKLLNNFGACNDSLTKNIIVLQRPQVSFFSNDTVSCKTPFPVAFTNTSSGWSSCLWTFGDGGTSTLTNPMHVYSSPGNYTVHLTCTNSFGCTTDSIRTNYIRIQLPQASINNLPQQGCAPFNWTFSSSVLTSDAVTGYQWSFGDGGTSTLSNPSHTFNAGTYNIQLIITTASGCTDTVIIINGIRAGVKPVPAFSATPRNLCAHLPVNFTDLSTGSVNQWLWDFGDGGTATTQNPAHIYQDTGYFNVTLIVWNNGCPDTVRYINYIHVNPPIAIFTVTATCNEPLKRIFTDHSIGADQWNWDFGDGNTSVISSPVHIYATAGTYIVTLTVTNFSTGCTYTKSTSLRLISENINFTASDTILCRKNRVNFTATGSNPLNILSYQWTFGDGGTATGHDVSHVYNAAGSYDVSLIMINLNGCRDTLVRRQYIRVNGPTAAFNVSAGSLCLLSTVTFTDLSTDDSIHPIQQWVWNYGDGITETLSSGPFQHTYTTPGIYTVTLMVNDNSGCSDTLVRSNAIIISRPVAGFSADTISCPGTTLHFLSSSTGSGLTYRWSFGDGGTSINSNPFHAYSSDGLYSVTLVIYDQYGCKDSLTKTNYITIITPIANFTVSDSSGTCPPLIVAFTNSSQNYRSISWDFGDGTFSTNPNPSHFYNTPGTFNAELTITGPGGCISTKQKTITVRGPYGSFSYNPLQGCNPLPITFIANTQNRVSFVWDFNDGNTSPTTDSIVTHIYTIPGRYIPKMILVDAGGCTVAIRGIDTIVVHGVVAGLNFNASPYCNPATVQFNNTSTSDDVISVYEWKFGDSFGSAAQNPSHLYNVAGTYFPKLKVTTFYGCTDSITSFLPVKIVDPPLARISQSPDGCIPVTINFIGSLVVADSATQSWQWDFGNGNVSSAMNPPAQIYNTPGTYPVRLLVTNNSGCADTIVTSVHAFALPDVDAGINIVICQGTGKALLATGAINYLWSPATGLSCTTCATPIANPATITTYTVTGTSSQGCIKKDSVIVSVKYPFNIIASLGDSVCRGGSVILKASGAYIYAWSPAAGLNSVTSATPLASPNISTTYMVIGSDDKNCFSDTAYIPVRVMDIPTVEAGADRTINVGQTSDLIPQISADVVAVNWSPTGSIFRSDYPSVTVKPKETTNYVVEVKTTGGCVSRDQVTIHVICNGSNVFIPNTFSPNGDGANDVFYPRGTGLFSIKTARIFNRWGEVVYEKSDFMPNDASSGWDGTYKGQKLNPDVYVYTIEVYCDNNSLLIYKGNIALIK